MAFDTMGNRTINWLLFCSVIVLGLGASELASRFFYRQPWSARLIEEQVNTDWRKNIRLNARGLRDRDYPAAKPPKVHRVLILGDSFTFGDGVAEDAAVFPELLEQSLAAEFGARGESVEILNGGISGSLTGDWVDLLAKVENEFDPDVVLVVFFLRDGTRTTSMGGFFGPIRDEITQANAASKIYQASYFFRWLKDAADKARISKQYAVALKDSYFGGPRQTEEWRRAQQNLIQIREMSRKRGARMGLVVFPVLVELTERYPFQEICEVVSKFGESQGIPSKDLLPAFLGQEGTELWVSSYNQHPNAKGHRIAAEAIKPFLAHLIAGP